MVPFSFCPLYVLYNNFEFRIRETTTKLLYLEVAHPGLPQPKKAELFCVLRFFYVASINLMQFVTTMCNLIVHTQVQICQHHQSTTKYTPWLGCPPCNALEYRPTLKIIYIGTYLLVILLNCKLKTLHFLNSIFP